MYVNLSLEKVYFSYRYISLWMVSPKEFLTIRIPSLYLYTVIITPTYEVNLTLKKKIDVVT